MSVKALIRRNGSSPWVVPRILVQDRAFTLVELIIVIIILGILAALAIPQFTASTTDAKEATLKADLAILRKAINLY